MEIQIDKIKVWKRIFVGDVVTSIIWGIIGIFILWFIYGIFKWNKEEVGYPMFKVVPYLFLFIAIILIWHLTYKKLWLNSIVYHADPDKLTETYTILTKSRNQARLQVVNDINFNQGIIDRLFGLFDLEVTYGFGDEGYSFTYQYLSEEKANELSDFIKAKGKVIDLK